ncbi:hypothetical protein Tco_0502034 [Tanacetum coccineum]
MAFNLQIQSSQPLDEAWGIVGLPNGIRVLVEEGGNFYPWGGLGCRLWDCQLGNLTAGKVYGGGGKGLSMGEIGLQGKRVEVKP